MVLITPPSGFHAIAISSTSITAFHIASIPSFVRGSLTKSDLRFRNVADGVVLFNSTSGVEAFGKLVQNRRDSTHFISLQSCGCNFKLDNPYFLIKVPYPPPEKCPPAPSVTQTPAGKAWRLL